jgi:predicted nucleotidyltransferase
MNNIFENIDLSKIKNNKTLNPLFFDENNKIKNDIRKKILNIFNFYIEKSENEKHFIIEDLILTGSNVNYNYNSTSDIDFHIIIDKSKNTNFDLLNVEAKLFNLKYNIVIESHEIELYVQDKNEKHNSSGVYSILNNNWIIKPEYENVQVDKEEVEKKYNNLINKIEYILDNNNIKLEYLKNFIDKLKIFRKSGLEKTGEFSIENLVFKQLKSNGYIDKLYNYLKNLEIKTILK